MRLETCEEARFQKWALEQCDGSGLKGIKRCDQVAAVDRGNGNRQQRLQRIGGVPVVEMAAVERQLCDGRVAVLHEVGVFGRGEKAEFTGGLARVGEQTEIGGRDACCFEKPVFFDIVGYEVIVARAAVFVKEAPDAERLFAEEEVVFALQLLPWFAGRAVEPAREVVFKSPKNKDGRGGD